nr:hypothetical protein [Tessaracoccus coleopterorum]
MVGLGIALNTLPTGTAYAVWTATGPRSPCCGRW